jgi:hypothetical protein
LTGQRVDWSSLPQGNLHIVVYAVDGSGDNPEIYTGTYINKIARFNDDPNINSNYNRDAAVNYMLKYGNYGAGYTRNPNYKDVGADCTSFTSQCLIAGGLEMKMPENPASADGGNINYWFYKKSPTGITALDSDSDTWGTARGFRKYWGGIGTSMHAYGYLEYKSTYDVQDDFDYLLKTLQPGDVFQVIRQTTNEAHHSMIVQDVTKTDIIYAQHSNDKVNQSLKDALNKWPTDDDTKGNMVDFILIKKG